MRNLVVVFVLSSIFFCSCGSRAKKDAEAGLELSFWHIMNYAGPREVIAAAVSRFESAHPGCRVRVQTFENDAYKMKLAVEEASGNAPDVFFTWGGGPLQERARAGKVLNLQKCFQDNDWEGRFIGQALELCRWEGQLYALPLDLSAVLLWCNQALFERHQVEYPADYAELLRVCNKFRQAGIHPFALGNMKQWPGAFYFCYLANRCGGTGLFLDAAAGKPGASFADPAFVRAGELLQELIALPAFPLGFNGMDDAPARAMFLRQEAAMYLTGTWLAARIIEEKPEFMEQLRLLPFPSVPEGKGEADAVLGGVNCAFAVSSSCKHPELALKLLEYLCADEVVTQWCRIGRLPALKTSPEQEDMLPEITRQSLQALQKASSLQPYYDQYLSPRLAVEHKNTTQHLFSGTMTPEQAAQKMGGGGGH